MIGILDWGIGGLGVYREICRIGKHTKIVYLSDSGYTPYGKLTKPAMRARLIKIAEFFKQKDVLDVLVACNAASSAFEKAFINVNGIRFHSIIPHAVMAVQRSRSKKIAVIGGDMTIRSKVYEINLAPIQGKVFEYCSAQPLSALVEAGEIHSDQARFSVQTILESIGEIEGLLLACTHYPALNHFFKQLAPHVEIIDPAELMAKSIQFNLEEKEKTKFESSFGFYTTGNAICAVKAAREAFGIDIGDVKPIGLV